MGPDEQAPRTGPQAPGGAGGGALEALERAWARVRVEPGTPLERAERLAALERDLLALAGAEPGGLPRARDPGLAAAARWQRQCLSTAPCAAEPVRAVVVARLAEGVRAAGRAPDPGGPEADAGACFARLAAATDLDREALDLGGASGLPPGPPGPLRVDVAPLRAALVAAVRAAPPDDARRLAWVRALTDRAQAVRTGLDELPPGLAALHLRRVAEDLAWHRGALEPARGPRRRALARTERGLTAAAQERALEARLEGRFGAGRVAAWERLVFGAVAAVLALLALEALVALPLAGRLALAAVDTLACLVLLTDFAVRWAHVEGRGRWFLRHVWLDLLPSLPLSWLSLAHVGGEPLHAGVGLRLIQLPRFARVLRVLLPLLRVLRAVGFLARGVDRLARGYGRFLDRDVILHPTREERRAAELDAAGPAARLEALAGALEGEWGALLALAPSEQREALVRARLAALAAAPLPSARPARPALPRAPGQTTAEAQIDRLARAAPEDLAVRLDPDLLQRLARAVRLFAHAPLRWTPFVRRYLPRVSAGMGDAEVVAAAAHAAARELGRHHRRWLWFADLYGTLTPAEFVDRLGTALVRSTLRPAYRLAVLGGAYVLVSLLIELVGGAFLTWVSERVAPLVGDTLVVLGAVCFAFLALGWWMKRTANQATAFYEALTGAQFLELMETVKGRGLPRDAALLEARVLAPEARLAGEDGPAAAHAQALAERVAAWLREPQHGGAPGAGFDALGRTALLYRDALDGGLFLESDGRTARQFLGNPTLTALRRRSGRVDAAERRALRALDFDRPPSALRGPYVWFSFLAQAVVQTVGRLLADYNRSVLPLSELAHAAPEERARHEAWLAAHHGEGAAAGRGERVPERPAEHASGEFIALHFLDDDPARDREVLLRYGPRVLEHLVADRRFLVRRIFGTYPLHLRPRAERVLNLRRLYETWFARGRALLLPLRFAWRTLAFGGTLLTWVARAVREVRRPDLRASAEEAAEADFATALRKIDRVRGPLADACLWLRARLDVEYLGLAVPGAPGEPGAGATVDADLAFLGGRGALAERVARERAAARADLERLGALLAGGLLARLAARLGLPPERLGPEHRRALVAAYRMDLDQVRTRLSAAEVLEATASGAGALALGPVCPLRRAGRRRAFRAWWRARGGGPGDRAQAWRAVARDVDGAGRCLDAWARLGPEAARLEGEARLAELLRHPARVTEMLVTLRAVQTLSLLDVRTYREHVWRLGRYADAGDLPGDRLTLPPEPPSPAT